MIDLPQDTAPEDITLPDWSLFIDLAISDYFQESVFEREGDMSTDDVGTPLEEVDEREGDMATDDVCTLLEEVDEREGDMATDDVCTLLEEVDEREGDIATDDVCTLLEEVDEREGDMTTDSPLEEVNEREEDTSDELSSMTKRQLITKIRHLQLEVEKARILPQPKVYKCSGMQKNSECSTSTISKGPVQVHFCCAHSTL
jgi:hypothetical protein